METIKTGAEEMSDEYILKLNILKDLKSRKQELVDELEFFIDAEFGSNDL